MLRGEPIALLLSVLLGLVLVSERNPRVRALRVWPVIREALPVLSVILAAQCAAHWFTAVSEIRPPMFLPCLAASAALALPAAVATGRARRIVAGSTIVVVAVLALSDALYYRFFGAIVPLLGASNAKQAWNVTGSIAEIFMSRDLVFVALSAVGGWLIASRGEPKDAARNRIVNLVFRGAIGASLLGVLVLGFDVRRWLNDGDSRMIFSWRSQLHEIGIFGSHARDLARRVRASRTAGEPPSPERVRALAAYLDAKRAPPPDELFGVARGKNLIVVQVEGMQEWVIDTRVRGVEITPFLNRLRRERALYFNGVWDQVAMSPTADSEFLSLNSLHPLSDAAVVFRYPNNDFVTLPSVLARQGYSTFSAHAFERGFWNRATIHPRYGFQHSYFDREVGAGPKLGWGLSDKVFLLRALERADSVRHPFMGFFITLTSHHPYSFIPPEEKHIVTTGLPEMLAGYVESMRFVDEALSGFFEALATRPYAKDTVVAIYGDHESKIPLDDAGEAQAREMLSLDAQTVKDLAKRSIATKKIPLFVVLPDAQEGRVFTAVGGQLDTTPTLLHLLGVQQPQSMIGRPLLGSGGAMFRWDGSAVEGDRVRLSNGNCRLLSGKGLPKGDCDELGKRASEQLQASWMITQYNLAERLSGERRAASR